MTSSRALSASRTHVNLLLVASLLTAAIFSAQLISPAEAEARWNPRKFATLLQTADSKFTEGEFLEAREAYTELRTYLVTSIERKEIPRNQLDRAKQALGTIDYQLARTVQIIQGCDAGVGAFEELRVAKRLEFAVAVKVETRLAEVLLCRASQFMDERSFKDAEDDIAQAQNLLASTGDRRLHVALSEDQASNIKKSLGLESTGIVKRLIAKKAWDVGYCRMGHNMVSVANSLPSDVVVQDVQALRDAVDTRCKDVQAVDTVEPDQDTSGGIWGAYALMGIGGALLLAVPINELRVATIFEEFETASDECEAGTPASCEDALALKDDVDTGGVISVSLGVVGAAALGGGLLWWYLESDAEAQSAEQATLHFTPLEGGAWIGATFTLD